MFTRARRKQFPLARLVLVAAIFIAALVAVLATPAFA